MRREGVLSIFSLSCGCLFSHVCMHVVYVCVCTHVFMLYMCVREYTPKKYISYCDDRTL